MKIHFAYIIFSLFVLFHPDIYAQQNKTDSLKAVLNKTTNDSTKVEVLHQLYLASDSAHYSQKGLEIAKKIGYKEGIAQALLDIGRYYFFDGKQDVSLDYLIKSVTIADEIGAKKILSTAYRYIGYIYRPHDSFTAEDYYRKSLKLSEEIKDEVSASYALSAIGNIYEGIYEGASDNNKKALEYYSRSLEIRERKGSNEEIASSLNETSRIYDLLGLYDKGLELRLRGLEIAERSGSTENIIFLCNVLGNDYSLRLHEYKKGLEYQLRAYKIAQTEKNDFDVMFDITKGLAYSYYCLGDLKNSNEFYRKCISINDSVRGRAKSYDFKLSMIKHGLEEELAKQKLLLKDSEIAKVKERSEKQAAFRNALLIVLILVCLLVLFVFVGNRQKLRLNRELDLKNKKIETAYQTLTISENKFKQITETIDDVFYLYNIAEKKYEYISPNSARLIGAEPQFFYDGNSMKHFVVEADLPLLYEANGKVDSGIGYDIEYRVLIDNEVKWVAEKSSPIFDEEGNLVRNSGVCRDITERKNAEEILQKKNKDITDSILYARTIQDAILVPKEEMAKRLKDFFILSKPKDIVSGDFYFYKETKNGLIVAVADCTGHGVPAGFMSMIGNAFLNEIINTNDNITPARILDQLRKMVIKLLNQNTTDSESRDGMDIALLCFDNTNSTVQYAGAFNSLCVIRNGTLTEIKADMFPIGIHAVEKFTPFTNNTIELQKNDSLYIFSDGFAGQFGGPKGRKLMKKQMRELLLTIQDKNMAGQDKILTQTFDEWKGDLEQVDDVMVFGIRI